MFLTRISINQPVFATMMMLALLVLGGFAYSRLSVEQFPDIDIPVVVITAQYPGASPETVESEITRPIEQAVNSISGVDTLTSRSYEGRAVIQIQFTLSVNGANVTNEVRDKVSAVASGFRREIRAPQISQFNPDDQPIISVAINSDKRSLVDLTTIAQQTVLRKLNSVSGVGLAYLVGAVPRQIQIQMDPARMQAANISVNDITTALRQENRDYPAGNIRYRTQDEIVQVNGRIIDPKHFSGLLITRRDNVPIRIGDVATVSDTSAEILNKALYNTSDALAVNIVKVQGANAVDVADGVRQALGELETSVLPADVKFNVVRDSSIGIKNSVANVQNTLLEGGVLTIVIVFLFLNSWRSTVITGLTLPISVIGTFAAMNALGFTLNIMTLMALSLSVGILIDDAIVVRENITRHIAMGKSHRQAALDGTNEIGLAVLATTLSIVAVFVPVAFMGGIIGKFFLQFGLTVACAVLISLFVSFTLDPMLSSLWYDPAAHGKVTMGALGRLLQRFDRQFERFARWYRSVLALAMRRGKTTLAAALLIFVGSFGLAPLVGVEFQPSADLGEMQVDVTAPTGASVEYTALKVKQVVNALKEFPEVDYTYSSVNSGGVSVKNKANVYVKLIAISDRDRSPKELAIPMRARLAGVAGIKVAVNDGAAGAGAKPIQLSVEGYDLATLSRLSEQVMAIVQKTPGVVDAESSLTDQRPTLAVKVDRQAANALGVSTSQIANTLYPLFGGEVVSGWRAPNDETYDVLVRLPENAREQRADLKNLLISVPGGDGGVRTIPLREIATIEQTTQPSQVDRRNLLRSVTILANTNGRPAGDANTDIKKALTGLQMPEGYRVAFAGSDKNINETALYAGQALLLAIIFIYLILASQFGSFLQPVAIMASLPLSLIGVFLGLLIAGSTLNIFSAIGFIMLMGLVTKNAILLVDFANQARAAGATLHDALLEAATIRLRPIVMTTLAMVFGMFPLALGLGEGGEQRAPMAHAVIGGLISSTILTLIVVPVILGYLDRLGDFVSQYLPKSADAGVEGVTQKN